VAQGTVKDDGSRIAKGQKSAREFPLPNILTSHGPAKVISVVNQKGGVGKTTSTINLGAALAGYGRKVLLVDFDPQGALSVGLGISVYQLEKSLFHVLGNDKLPAKEVMVNTGVENLDLLPSNIELSAIEMQLVSEVGREQALQIALQPLMDEYDYIIIDCQPSLGLLTVNALAASDGCVVPLETEYFALRGLALLTQTVDKIKSRINPRLEIIGILPTMYDPRTVHGREVLERVEEAFGDKVFETVIVRTVKFPETTAAGSPITEYAPKSPAAKAYMRLARELIFKF
jgi:chromosome partitioning protein